MSGNDDVDEWKVWNWCWERDYNKHPVVSFNHNKRRRRNIEGMTKDHSSNDEDGRGNSDDDDDDDDNGNDDYTEKKPSATDHQKSDEELNSHDSNNNSFFDDWVEGNWCYEKTTVPAAAAAVSTEARKEESFHRDGNTNNDGDDNFYDDWMEGNWGFIDNDDNKNSSSSGENSSSKKKHQKDECQITITERSTDNTRRVIALDGKRTSSSRDHDDEMQRSTEKRYRRNTTNRDDVTTTNKRKRQHSIDCADEESDTNNNEEDDDADNDDDSGINNQDDDDGLSPYERLRLARMKRNDERLKSLGLIGGFTAISSQNAKKKNKNTKKRRDSNNDVRVLRVVTPRKKSHRIQYHEEQWTNMYYNLVQYNKIHKDYDYCDDPDLAQWISEQRRDYSNGELRPHRIAVLNSIHFHWDDGKRCSVHNNYSCNEEWMGMFQKLVAYKECYKHTSVQKKNDLKLGDWISWQRHSYKKNRLLPNRVELLNSIGFEWDGVKASKERFDQGWMKMYQKLVAYNDCNKTTMIILPSHKEDPQLVGWINTQCCLYNNGELSPDRIDYLNSIGFDWEGNKGAKEFWMKMFQQLVTYKELHNHTLVPSGIKHTTGLHFSTWVQSQRSRKSKLSKERIDLLNSIDFDWEGVRTGNDNNELWTSMFERLITPNASTDPKLRSWVATQRGHFKKNKLSKERIDKLDSIDFVWRIR